MKLNNFKALSLGMVKCTYNFGQMEFLTAPIVRTSRFQKYPFIGQQVFRNPYISDKEVIMMLPFCSLSQNERLAK